MKLFSDTESLITKALFSAVCYTNKKDNFCSEESICVSLPVFSAIFASNFQSTKKLNFQH
jgi:hypothetical protein